MGCGASKQEENEKPLNNHQGHYDDEEEEEDRAELYREDESRRQSVSSQRSNLSQISTSSNKFTTSFATGGSGSPKGSKYEPQAAYSPGSANAEAEWEKWKQRNIEKSKEGEEKSKTGDEVDTFVFGDFAVDPGDVQTQRLERVNRVRLLTKRRSFGAQGFFAMNDFVVNTVDEGDDPGFLFLHEVKVPEGFHRLKKFHMKNLLGHTSRVKTIAVAPNETEFASASMEDTVTTMYEINTGAELSHFMGHNAPIIATTFSADGRYLATSSRDNRIVVWDTMHKDAQKRQVRDLEHTSLPICCAFSHDGQHIISGCQDRTCLVWDIEKAEVVCTYEEHEGVVVCVSAMPQENVAVTGGGDRVARLWSTDTGETIRQFIGHDGVVISVNFTPNAEKLLTNDDRACKMWNVETGACVLNVTLESLTRGVSTTDFPGVMPLSKEFVSRTKHSAGFVSAELGMQPTGISGPQAQSACKIASQRAVFTLSCLCPGPLAQSFFAVASTNKTVYIVSCMTGKEETSFNVKAAVFAIAPGRGEKLIFGDVYGNMYDVTLVAEL